MCDDCGGLIECILGRTDIPSHLELPVTRILERSEGVAFTRTRVDSQRGSYWVTVISPALYEELLAAGLDLCAADESDVNASNHLVPVGT